MAAKLGRRPSEGPFLDQHPSPPGPGPRAHPARDARRPPAVRRLPVTPGHRRCRGRCSRGHPDPRGLACRHRGIAARRSLPLVGQRAHLRPAPRRSSGQLQSPAAAPRLVRLAPVADRRLGGVAQPAHPGHATAGVHQQRDRSGVGVLPHGLQRFLDLLEADAGLDRNVAVDMDFVLGVFATHDCLTQSGRPPVGLGRPRRSPVSRSRLPKTRAARTTSRPHGGDREYTIGQAEALPPATAGRIAASPSCCLGYNRFDSSMTPPSPAAVTAYAGNRKERAPQRRPQRRQDHESHRSTRPDRRSHRAVRRASPGANRDPVLARDDRRPG